MGIGQIEKLIGLGCDGANINVSDKGLRGKLAVDRPWLITTWCMTRASIERCFEGHIFP